MCQGVLLIIIPLCGDVLLHFSFIFLPLYKVFVVGTINWENKVGKKSGKGGPVVFRYPSFKSLKIIGPYVSHAG